jgi:4-cresol dehydrogenase (hydroxylating)
MPESVLEAFRAAIGADHVIADPAGLQRYGWCTTPVHRHIPAVLRPASLEEVRAIVGIAATNHVALYPISTGNNWGYGSAQPMRENSLVLDLGRLNRIVSVDAELGYAVIEPGVTQQQLYSYLQDNNLRLWLNPTGAGPRCSILGNTLERGFGIGPNGDHFAAQCGMEVVLSTGEILRTGFGHYDGARATHVYKWGVGPYLDGLFTQSNFGIVTKIGVWLMPEPEAFEACYFTCYSEEQLGPTIDAVRRLLFDGVFKGPLNLLHRNRVLIMLGRYPWEGMNGRTPLDEDLARDLAARAKIGAWNGVGAICGTPAQVRGARQSIKRALGPHVDRLTFLSETRLRVLKRFPNLFSLLLRMNVPDLLHALQNSYGMMRGVPSEVALSLAYWRNRQAPATGGVTDPGRDNCGLMWFAPIIPMTRKDVAAFRSIVEPIMRRHGFEACITLTAVNERCFDCTLPLLFNKQDENEVQRAKACYAELSARCREQGFIPYRLGIQSMEEETSRDDVFWDVVDRLKGAMDPERILAPGRYAR